MEGQSNILDFLPLPGSRCVSSGHICNKWETWKVARMDGMSKTHIGDLRRGDVFILDGQKYKISGLSITKEVNNVLCVGVDVKRTRIWLDVDTEVEVEE